MSQTSAKPAVFVFGPPISGLEELIARAGAVSAESISDAEGVIVTYGADPAAFAESIKDGEKLRWAQLPSAGIEVFRAALSARPELTWTSAKGAYAKPVAEHALALTLALLRDLPERIRAKSWGKTSGISLHGLNAVIVGAGGVAVETARLLRTFDTRITIVRRHPDPVEIADRTISLSELPEVLPSADVLVLGAALTDETRNMISAEQLQSMKSSAVIVNIARGGLIDTDALVTALAENQIKAAALDVTEPEPLPDGHPLWDEPNCIITPHTADTMEMIIPLYLDRIGANIAALTDTAPFEGLVNAELGY